MMIDLHCHLLPGLDDGAETLANSLQIAEQLQRAGFTEVFVTPHVMEGQPFLEATRILEAAENLQRELEKAGSSLKLHPGGEHYIFPDLAKWLKAGNVLSLGNTGKYLLLELPMLEIPSYTEQVFFELQVQGITPILAHPERHHQLAKEPQTLYEWIRKGVLYQVNLRSLTGRYGPTAQETARTMLQCGLVHFIGSDAHYPLERPEPYLKELEAFAECLDEKDWKRITVENPRAILEGKGITFESEQLKEWPSQRGWTERFKGLLRRQK